MIEDAHIYIDETNDFIQDILRIEKGDKYKFNGQKYEWIKDNIEKIITINLYSGVRAPAGNWTILWSEPVKRQVLRNLIAVTYTI